MPIQDFQPRIHLNESDFTVITNNGDLCDDKGRLGPRAFELSMRKQLRLFAQRQLADTLMDDTLESTDIAQLATLKILLRDESHTYAGENEKKDNKSDRFSGQMRELHETLIKMQDDLQKLRIETSSRNNGLSFVSSPEITWQPANRDCDESSRRPDNRMEQELSNKAVGVKLVDKELCSGGISPHDLNLFCQKLVQPICSELAELRKAVSLLVPKKQKAVQVTVATDNAKCSRKSPIRRHAARDDSSSPSQSEPYWCEERANQQPTPSSRASDSPILMTRNDSDSKCSTPRSAEFGARRLPWPSRLPPQESLTAETGPPVPALFRPGSVVRLPQHLPRSGVPTAIDGPPSQASSSPTQVSHSPTQASDSPTLACHARIPDGGPAQAQSSDGFRRGVFRDSPPGDGT